MQNHDNAFRQMKTYYNDITNDNLSLIKSLKVGQPSPSARVSADVRVTAESRTAGRCRGHEEKGGGERQADVQHLPGAHGYPCETDRPRL
jgi:hypothetical protein